MDRLLALLLVLFSTSSLAQSTLFSPVQIPYSSSNYVDYGRGLEEWNGKNTWDNVVGIPLPNGVNHGKNYYYRFFWPALEPAQDSYAWSIFDTQIQYAITKGLSFSFRVMDMCTACLSAMSYPLYLHNLMQSEAANSRDWMNADGNWIPNWNSPNYQARWAALLNAIAIHIANNSYNGVPYSSVIYYIDVSGFGDFGEWHTYPWTGKEPADRKATGASLKAIIDASKTAFPNFQLGIPIAAFQSLYVPPSVGYYALTTSNSYGQIGWRRDNWGNALEDATLVNNTNFYNPGDSVHHFKYLILNKHNFAPITGEPIKNLMAVSTCGSPYCDLPREFNLYGATSMGNGNYPVNPVSGNVNLMNNIIAASRIMGYRLTIDSGRTTTSPVADGSFQVTMHWDNLGISPVYEKYVVQFELRNNQSVVWTGTSSFTPKLFLHGTRTITDNFTLTGVAAGTYSLYIIVRDPNSYKTPLTLNITGRGADGSYLIRSIVPVASNGASAANVKNHQK